MLDMFTKTFMTALGAASMTQKKADEFVQELKDRFQVSEEEGRDLLHRLRQAAEENQQHVQEQARSEVQKACNELGVVTRDEVSELEQRVSELEKRVAAAPSTSSAPE